MLAEHLGLFPQVAESHPPKPPPPPPSAVLEHLVSRRASNHVASGAVSGAAHTAGRCDARDLLSVREWYALGRERPECVSRHTRVVLRGGVAAVPVVGLGTGSPDDEPAVIAAALQAGYGLIDTGELYANEAPIRRALELSGVSRESVLLSSKASDALP